MSHTNEKAEANAADNGGGYFWQNRVSLPLCLVFKKNFDPSEFRSGPSTFIRTVVL
jgi:hypothetical protein